MRTGACGEDGELQPGRLRAGGEGEDAGAVQRRAGRLLCRERDGVVRRGFGGGVGDADGGLGVCEGGARKGEAAGAGVAQSRELRALVDGPEVACEVAHALRGGVGAAVGRACAVNGGRRAQTVAAGSASAAAVRPSGRIGALGPRAELGIAEALVVACAGFPSKDHDTGNAQDCSKNRKDLRFLAQYRAY